MAGSLRMQWGILYRGLPGRETGWSFAAGNYQCVPSPVRRASSPSVIILRWLTPKAIVTVSWWHLRLLRLHLLQGLTINGGSLK